MTDLARFSWEEALREFLLHCEATRAVKTLRYYKVQLSGIITWAEQNDIPFDGFGKRHLDRYLIERKNQNKSQLTLHHDAVCAKAFYAWCSKNDIIDRSPLAEYQVRNAATPAKYMPSDEDMHRLLTSVYDYWNVQKNPAAKYQVATKRAFHRDRNYAILLGLLDSAARIGEILSLKVGDYRAGERQITIRESKGREPRLIPVSGEWADALTIWVKLRTKVTAGSKEGEDEGWLFISEYGTRLDECRFLKTLKSYLVWAGIDAPITLHSLRRYSLNRLAKVNLLAAQTIAGHKETKTTLIYTKIDPDFIRDIHSSVGVVKGILHNSRAEKATRRKLI